uniref:AlNc14C124G6767 protein n=1 Tax=Albugo laibachii Nc14 TaxID=890382 RepID=F0WJP2_9STRA|nr:AlNc14C124G6767 [Albugo laibachii Nc14]|eukprot:CCA21492.1 AlNc14C124G6767 [Albugo laibachii Nc14]
MGWLEKCSENQTTERMICLEQWRSYTHKMSLTLLAFSSAVSRVLFHAPHSVFKDQETVLRQSVLWVGVAPYRMKLSLNSVF